MKLGDFGFVREIFSDDNNLAQTGCGSHLSMAPVNLILLLFFITLFHN